MKSLISNKKQCYNCGSLYNLHLHHIIFGKNRKNAEEDGLTCYLCQSCHEGTNGVHGKNGHDLDMMIKKEAEKKWLEYYNKTIDDFIKRYGKNYI